MQQQQQQQQQQQTLVVRQSMPEKPQVRTLCLDCLKRTSVRGLPRILSAKSFGLRALWTLAVLAFFGLLLYNVVKLTFVYIRGDVILSFEPWTPRPPFPNITVCDSSPMTLSGMRRFNLTPRAYSRHVLDLARATTKPVQPSVLSQLLSPTAYHDHLHLAEFQAAMREVPLVLAESCRVQMHQNRVLVDRPCDRVDKLQVPGYFSCSTVTVAETAERVTFHLLLDSESDSLECSKCISGDTETLNTGAILFLHERGSYPISVGEGLRIMPGTQNFVLVKTTRSMQRRFCSETSPETLEFQYSGLNLSSKYSKGLCDLLHRHDQYQMLCNCSVDAMPHAVEDDFKMGVESTMPLCHRQQPLIQMARFDSRDLELHHLDRVDCVLRVDGRLPVPPDEWERFQEQMTTKECPDPCHQVQFSVARSQAKGVDKNSVLDIFERYVHNTTLYPHLEDRLSVYAEALRLREAGNKTEAAELLRGTTYLEDNFMTIVLNFNAKQARVQSENYILGLSAFISQIGGLLALFSGITVVCVAEVAELLWLLTARLDPRRLVCRSCQDGAARDGNGGGGDCTVTVNSAKRDGGQGPEAVAML